MKGYKNVEVSVKFLEEFRKVREEYYNGLSGFPESLDYSISDSDLCNVALYSVINALKDEIYSKGDKK